MTINFLTYHQDSRCGCTTFIEELSRSLLNIDDKKFIVKIITLGCQTPCVEVIKKESITFVNLPALGRDRWLMSVCLLSTIIEDATDNLFLLGFTPSYEIAKFIKKVYPFSKLIHVIHDFMWVTYVDGNVESCPYERIRASKQKDISKPCPLIKNNLQEILILHYKDRKKNA